MKLTTILLLLLCSAAFGQNTFYVSSSTGSNTNPGTIDRPMGGWYRAYQIAQPGDRILLKKGDTFFENNYFNKNKIYTGSYGEGDMPTFSGFSTPTNWVNEGDGVWSSYDPTFPGNLFVLAIDGQYYAKGRTAGYRTFQKHKGATATAALIDSSLDREPVNYTGYQVVIRKRGWVLDVGQITKHAGDTVYYGNNPGDQSQAYEPLNNYGYWLQNGPACLKQFGDWYFDVSTKKVYVRLGNTGPAGHRVQIGKTTRCFNLDGTDNIFDGIRITGYNQWGIIAGASFANNTFINCEFSFCGQYAIYSDEKPGLKVLNCRFLNNPNNAITGLRNTIGSNGWVIDGSYFYNTGVWPGMGKTGDVAYEAIAIEGDDATITNNRVIRTGYNPIYFKGSGVLIEGNTVDSFAIAKSDCGGIYTFQKYIVQNGKRRVIRNNVVKHGLGVFEGVAKADIDSGKTFSVYIDEHGSDVDLYGNDLSGASTANIFLHNAHDVNIDSNKLSGAAYNIRIRTYDVVNPTSNVNITRNKLATGKGQLAIKVDTDADNPVFGTIEGNQYITTDTTQKQFNIKQGKGTTYKNVSYAFASWKTAIRGDSQSVMATTDAVIVPPVVVPPIVQPPEPSYLFKVITPDGKMWGYDAALKLFSEVKQ